jgi:Domain of unknown function (DUF4148)
VKLNLRNVLIGIALVLPAIASAQESGSTVTRAQVRAELAALAKAGYRPGGRDPYYPSDIQAAEAKIHSSQVAGSAPTSASYGGTEAVQSESGPSVGQARVNVPVDTHH